MKYYNTALNVKRSVAVQTHSNHIVSDHICMPCISQNCIIKLQRIHLIITLYIAVLVRYSDSQTVHAILHFLEEFVSFMQFYTLGRESLSLF